MKRIKIGVIGLGSISDYHIRAYKAMPNVEVIALCTRNEASLAKAAKKYSVTKTYTDYDEMLKLSDLDGVSICTINKEHAKVAIGALNAGKHVLCEKPMALNAKEALAMEEAAIAAGKVLMIGFTRRFSREAEMLKSFMDEGQLGNIYYAKANYLRRAGFPGGWFGSKELAGGGPLIDLGVHLIDLVRYLTNKPKAVRVTAVTYDQLGSRSNIVDKGGYKSVDPRNTIYDVEDLAVALITFDNGMTLNLETSFSLNLKEDRQKVELFGNRGGAKLDSTLEVYTELNNRLVDILPVGQKQLSFDELFQKEIAHFIEAINKGKDVLETAKDGIEVMKIIDAIYLSAATGKEVRL